MPHAQVFADVESQLILAMPLEVAGCAHFIGEETEAQSCQACLCLPERATHPARPKWQVTGLGQILDSPFLESFYLLRR